jgi:flavorubredoxin
MNILYESDSHKNLMFDDLTSGSMVQANQHIIVHGDEALLLDPGGHKIYTNLFAELSSHIGSTSNLKHILFSHQDPDIIAAANGWMMMTDAQAYLSALWMRFIPHFGVDELVIKRIKPIPDEGMVLEMAGQSLKIIPAHFLHSAGNFQVYDPESKILYSGDLGASLGQDYSMVVDFDSHIQYMEGFHKRYMPTAKALKMWAKMARKLDIEIIAPQHGAVFGNRDLSNKFIDWVDDLPCGLDLMGEEFIIP